MAAIQRQALSPEVRDFLASTKTPGVLATIGRSGGPVTSAVWFGLEGDAIVVSTPEGGSKARNAGRDGRVSFIVDSRERPYRGVAIEGRAQLQADAGLDRWRKIARRYLGDDLDEAMRRRAEAGPRIVIVIEPLRVRAWNLGGTVGG